MDEKERACMYVHVCTCMYCICTMYMYHKTSVVGFCGSLPDDHTLFTDTSPESRLTDLRTEKIQREEIRKDGN